MDELVLVCPSDIFFPANVPLEATTNFFYEKADCVFDAPNIFVGSFGSAFCSFSSLVGDELSLGAIALGCYDYVTEDRLIPLASLKLVLLGTSVVTVDEP